MQVAVIVSQNVVDSADLSTASAMALFFQLLGGAVWLSVAQSLFSNKLIQELEKNVKSVGAGEIFAVGATKLRDLLHGDELHAAIESYMAALKNGYTLTIALAGLSVFIGIFSIVLDRRKKVKHSPAKESS